MILQVDICLLLKENQEESENAIRFVAIELAYLEICKASEWKLRSIVNLTSSHRYRFLH
jgi:hypothetical protein